MKSADNLFDKYRVGELTIISPKSGLREPEIIRSSVVLPVPFSPTTEIQLPSLIEKSSTISASEFR